MAKLVIRDIEEPVMARLEDRAKRNGRSVEDEVRSVLEVASMDKGPRRLGTEIAALFWDAGLTKEIPEWRGELVKPATFD